LDGKVVIAQGEVTPKGSIYCYAVEDFLPPPKESRTWTNDDFPMPKGTPPTSKR
jgi:hypothetical protein